MTPQKQLELFDTFAAKLRETLVKKGADYATESDVLSNFKTSSKMAKISVLSVIIIEITKKVARIVNLSKKGKIAANEPLEDSILDLCGYAFLLLCAVTEKNGYAANVPEIKPISDNENGLTWAKIESEYNDNYVVRYCGDAIVHEGNFRECNDYLSKAIENEGFIISNFDGKGVALAVSKGKFYYEIVKK